MCLIVLDDPCHVAGCALFPAVFSQQHFLPPGVATIVHYLTCRCGDASSIYLLLQQAQPRHYLRYTGRSLGLQLGWLRRLLIVKSLLLAYIA